MGDPLCCYRWDQETSLYQVRFRYFHPGLGRWLSRDPIGELAGTNLYRYVSNSPAKFQDPLGLLGIGEGVETGLDELTKLILGCGEDEEDVEEPMPPQPPAPEPPKPPGPAKPPGKDPNDWKDPTKGPKTKSTPLKREGVGGEDIPWMNQVLIAIPPIPQGVIDFGAGFGDPWTWGATAGIRNLAGIDNVNIGSAPYIGGAVLGAGTQGALLGGATIARFPNSALVGKGSSLFGRGGQFGSKGMLNSGSLRIGWGWRGTRASGSDVFRVSWSTRGNRSYWNHLDFN